MAILSWLHRLVKRPPPVTPAPAYRAILINVASPKESKTFVMEVK